MQLPPEALFFGWQPRAGEIIFSYVLGEAAGGDRDKQYLWQKSVGMAGDRLTFGRLRMGGEW